MMKNIIIAITAFVIIPGLAAQIDTNAIKAEIKRLELVHADAQSLDFLL